MASLLEKDAGFCSGSSEHEDDHHPHDGMHSPTDTSEDSVEVKFTPIQKNKRKSSEPSRVVPDPELGPLKKRFRYEQAAHFHSETNLSHFRPWAPSSALGEMDVKPNPADILIRHPGVTTLHRAINTSDIEQEQPLALVAKKPEQQRAEEPRNNLKSNEVSIESLIKQTQISRLSCSSVQQPKQQIEIKKPLPSQPPSSSSASSTSSSKAATTATATSQKQGKTSTQRNYKNMTRERRIEANARERTRVHTISAAYDTLRHSIPSYSNSQKLSKLSVLRVACSYILYLSRLNGDDFSADQSEPPLSECVENVTRTIQTEGKLRRKKDE